MMKITSGRFINPLDLEKKRKVVVIGTKVYKDLFKTDEDPVGQSIRIAGIFFKVVGVYQSLDPNDDDESKSKAVFLPFTTFQQAFNYGNYIGWFSLTATGNTPVSQVREKLFNFLKKRYQIAPNDDQALGHWNMEKEFNKINRLFTGINFLVWFVGFFTLLAGVIGVSNIMLIIIRERTRENGIKRAVGATPLVIVQQIMLETILLTSVSGYFGLVMGVGVVEGIAEILDRFNIKSQMFQKPETDLNTALIALTVLIISGAAAGMIPAKRAVSIKPVDAIRDV